MGSAFLASQMFNLFQNRSRTICKIIYNTNIMAGFQQRHNRMRADIARSTRNKDSQWDFPFRV